MRLLSLQTLAFAAVFAAAFSLTPASEGRAPAPFAPADTLGPSVWSVSYARTHPGEQAAYLDFLALNWAEARRHATREGIVRSYRVLVRPDADEAEWDVMMITEYADSTAYADREAYFSAMFARPDWETRLVNGRTGRDLADLVGEEWALRSAVEHR